MSERIKKGFVEALPYLIGPFAGVPFFLLVFPPSGTDWIPGWPEFIKNSFYFLPMIFILPSVIVPILRAPLNEKLTRRRKRFFATVLIVCNILLVGIVAMFSKLSFFDYQKVDRYISSPNGKNKAVILSREYIPGFPNDEDIYPIRKRFLYERDNGISIDPNFYDAITLTWLDDNTLEITRTWEYDGEAITERKQLYW